MKNKYLLLLIAVMFCSSAEAQLSRLIGLTKAKYTGLDFTAIGDTAWYMYTGTMDSANSGSLAYDSSYLMAYSQGFTPANLSYRYYQTFSANNIATVTSQTYDTPSVSWVNYQYTTGSYDAANNLLIRILQGWNPTTLAWVNKEKDSFAYDAANNMIYHLAQVWDTTALQWRNNNQFMNTYNAANNITDGIRQVWNIGTSVFVNNTNTIYEYNATPLLTNTIVQRWDTLAGAWVNATQDTLYYDGASNVSTDTRQRWDTTAHSWVNVNINNYTYDAAHNMLTDTTLNWNNTSTSYVYNKLKLYDYNSYNQVLVYTTESWNNTSLSWYYRFTGPLNAIDVQYRYYYELVPPESVAAAHPNNNRINAYPNPANDILNINIAWQQPAAFAVTIYNITGSVVRQWSEQAATNFSKSLPVADLAAGNYIIRANNGHQNITHQFVIVK